MKFTILVIILFLTFSPNSYSMIPNVSQIKTDSGYSAWMIEDKYLPIISIKIVFEKSGSSFDKKGKEGLAHFVSSMLDEGAGGLTSLEYKKRLESLASSIRLGVSEDSFYVNIKTLKKNIEPTLELFNLVLTKPNFDENSLSRVKKQISVKINKQQEDPYNLAIDTISEIIFKDHPYGNDIIGTLESVNTINSQDLKQFTQEHFTRENIVISVVGDYKVDAMSDLLDKYLQIPNSKVQITDIADVDLGKSNEVIYKEFDVPQSTILFSAKSVKRDSEEFYPFYILNHIFGGGSFESRLMNEVREKSGLVYTIYSYIDTMEKVSTIEGYAGTDNNTVEKAIAIIKEEIDKIGKDGITQQELTNAKDYLINSFALKLNKNENIASFLSAMQTENLGVDFLNKRNDIIANISLDQINELSKKYFSSNQFTFVVVGGKADSKK